MTPEQLRALRSMGEGEFFHATQCDIRATLIRGLVTARLPGGDYADRTSITQWRKMQDILDRCLLELERL